MTITYGRRKWIIAGCAIAIAVGAVVHHRAPSPAPAAERTTARAIAIPTRAAHGAPPPATIAGTVHDERRQAIAGARVCALTASRTDPVCAASDLAGGYRLAVPPGSVVVGAMARTFAAATLPAVQLAPGEQRRDVDVVLEHGGVALTGTISDAGGGVVAHAHVRVDAMMTESDDAGHYELWLPPVWTTVAVSADGYANQLGSASPPGVADFALVPEASLAGRVVDASGAPAAGVRVTVAHAELDDHSNAELESAISDEGGAFAIERLEPGRYTVTARGPHGFGLAGSFGLAVGQHVTGVAVKLLPAYQVAGRITLGDGGPVCSGGNVALHDAIRHDALDIEHEPDGTFHSDGVLPGTYLADVSCDGRAPRATYAPIVVVDRDVTGLAWPVDPGGTIRGTVRGPGGEPLAGASLEADQHGGPPRIASASASATSDASGNYAISGLRPGRYRLAAHRIFDGSHAADSVEVEVVVADAGTVDRDVVIPQSHGAVTGQIMRSDGKPAGRIDITASTTDTSYTMFTDESGRFVMDELAAGPYHVTVGSQTGSLVGEPAEGHAFELHGGEVVKLALTVAPPAGVIRGRVTLAGDAPATDAYVSIAREDDNPIPSWAYDHEHVVAPDGTFEFRELVPGAYAVRAGYHGGAELVTRKVEVGADVAITLPETGELDGTVRVAAGAPDRFDVMVLDRASGMFVRTEQLAGTGGHYDVRDLPGGHYAVTVTSGHAQRTVDVELAAGEHKALDIAVAGTVTLVGRVVDLRTGKPVGGVEISAQLADNTSLPTSGAPDRSHVTGDDGRFVLPDVQRGRIAISGAAVGDLSDVLPQLSSERTIPDGMASDETIDIGDLGIVPRTAGTGNCGCVLQVVGDDYDTRVAQLATVVPDGAAAAAGVDNGDVVTAVDGVDVTGRNADNAALLLEGPAGASRTVTLARGPTVTIVLRD